MSQPRCLRKASATLVAKAHAAARAAAKAGAMPPTWARNATVRVHQPSRPGAIVLVRALRVWHVPPPTCETLHRDNCDTVDPSNAAPCCVAPTALLLCPYYELQACDTGAGECPSGSACPYVHADVRGAPEYQPHEKTAAARSAYERFAPGLAVTLAFPGRELVTVPSEQLLRTRALVGVRRVVGACEHFISVGRCDRGSQCTFAHPCTNNTPSVSSKRASLSHVRSESFDPQPRHGDTSDETMDFTISPLLTPHNQPAVTALSRAARDTESPLLPAAPTHPHPRAPADGPSAQQRQRRHYPYDAVALRVA